MKRVIVTIAVLGMLLAAVPVGNPAVASTDTTGDGFVVEIDAQSVDGLPAGSRHIVGDWYAVPGDVRSMGKVIALPGVRRIDTNPRAQLPPSEQPVQAVALASLAIPYASDPTDPSYGQQWHFPLVDAPAAWPLSTGAGVTVAVIDTGVSKGPDLACHDFVDEYDALTGTSGPGAAADWSGHGTHVAGTIAQCTNNGIGVAGLAYDARLMPIKAMDSGGGPAAVVADAIVWATDHGADVINMSLGWPCTGTWAEQPDCVQAVVSSAIEYAADHDVLLVAASGNDGYCAPTLGWVSFPANHPDVLGIGAVDAAGAVTGYSDCGVDLSMTAPGGDTSADLNADGNPDGVLQESFNSNGFGLFWMEGTSSASPHVAGAAAMLRAANPRVPAVGIRAALESTATDVGDPGTDLVYGAGVLDIAAALASPHLEVERHAGLDRFKTAAAISQGAFDAAGTVYVAAGEGFADGLAVGPVAGIDHAPILLVEQAGVPQATLDELTRLAPTDIVIIGGATAVSSDVETQLGAYGTVRRLGGTDRYDTARLIALDAFPTGASTVIVTTGLNYPDGLAAGPLGASLGAPVLLTRPDSLVPATIDALADLKPGTILVVGGESAVSAGVVAQLESLTSASVTRLAGADRYETAATIAQAAYPSGAGVVYVATGLDFPDALTAGPASAFGGGPLLLTHPTSIPAATAAELQRIGPSRIVVVGGRGAVADTVLLGLAAYIVP